MDYKFHFFPEAFPDETLHSVLSRYVRLCGIGSRQAAFAGERAAASFSQNVAFPSRLAEFVESLPRGTGLSVLGVIRRHTLLPYYAPFMTRAQLDHMQASMAGDGKGLMLKAGVNASRLAGASRVRFCPLCITEDRARAGAAYWHRVHQLPGVLVCPHHSCSLQIVSPGWFSRNARQLKLPDDTDVQSHSLQLEISSNSIPVLHQIAVRSLQVLGAEIETVSASSLRSWLLQGAVELGLAAGNHRLQLPLLAKHMDAFFRTLPPAWEYMVLSESHGGMPATWVTKLLRKPRASHHPLKYIALASALNVDMSVMLAGGMSQTPAIHCTKPELAVHEYVGATLDVECCDPPTSAVWGLVRVGADAKAIALALGVSLASVYRSVRAVEGGPETWRKARFASELHERRTAFEIDYQTLHAQNCRGYAWLYRCDRGWLMSCIRERGEIHVRRADTAHKFAKLDMDLANLVTQCAESLRTLPGKPVRISRTRIGRELHALSRFEKQLGKLPRCAAALSDACETVEEFHRRRLEWAKRELCLAGVPVTQSLLYRTASIRPIKKRTVCAC